MFPPLVQGSLFSLYFWLAIIIINENLNDPTHVKRIRNSIIEHNTYSIYSDCGFCNRHQNRYSIHTHLPSRMFTLRPFPIPTSPSNGAGNALAQKLLLLAAVDAFLMIFARLNLAMGQCWFHQASRVSTCALFVVDGQRFGGVFAVTSLNKSVAANYFESVYVSIVKFDAAEIRHNDVEIHSKQPIYRCDLWRELFLMRKRKCSNMWPTKVDEYMGKVSSDEVQQLGAWLVLRLRSI